MELEHHFEVPSDVATTWATFNDLEQVVPCFPGGTLTSVDGDDFDGTVRLKLGPISLTYAGTGTFVERDEAAGRLVMEAQGMDKRGNGSAGITVRATLSEIDSGTSIDVASSVNISGKPAQFGRGLIQRVSDKMLGQFLDCIKEKMASQSDS